MTRRLLRHVVMRALVVGCATSLVSAQPGTASAPSAVANTPVLTYQALLGFQTYRGVGTTMAEWPLAVAEDSWPMVVTATGEGCASSGQIGASMPALDPLPAGGPVARWRMQGRLVSFDGEKAVVRVRWSRRVDASRIDAGDAEEVEQELELGEGAQGVLDIVRPKAGVPGVCSSIGIGVGLGLRHALDVERAALQYDLWLIDRDGERVGRPLRSTVTAAQGQEARFLFEPVPLADAKPASAPQSTTMQVSGSIRGRARSDGTIEVAVDTWRGFQRDGAGVGAGSRKRLTARLGETIDLALPVELYRDASGAAAPHATAIRLTARRVW